MDKIKKFLDVEIKAVENEERTYWFIASTDHRDRQGDIIVQEGWKLQHFKKNPVILWGHDYYSTPIGKALTVKIEDSKLKIKVQFVPAEIDPFSAKVEKLVANGFLQTVSVGFMTYKQEDLTEADKKARPDMTWGKRLYGELLEVSVVPVPANPQALAERQFEELCVRSFTGRKEEKPEEIDSPLLPYRNADETVNPLKLRACFAAFAGARGGVELNNTDRPAVLRHLQRIAKENGVECPQVLPSDQEELRKEFADVWHGELLDIVKFPDEAEPEEPTQETTLEHLEIVKELISGINEVTAKLK